MTSKHLDTYLNNHLAGSVVAMELLDHVASVFKGSETERFALELARDIAEDKRTLEGLMGRLGIGLSKARRASAWVGKSLCR